MSLTVLVYAQPQSVQRPPDSILFERIPNIPGATSIVQDQQGFMWFAGGPGLERHKYDGYQVTHYYNDPEDDSSLADNYVEYLLVDRQGTLRVGTQSSTGGPNRYNPSTDTFTRYQNDPGDSTSLSNYMITVMK